MQTKSLPRFLTRTKRQAEPQPERVEGIYLQEQSFSLDLSDPSKDSERKRNGLPAGTILAEYTGAACKNSAAATTLFIP
jgi:hypothetical protein